MVVEGLEAVVELLLLYFPPIITVGLRESEEEFLLYFKCDQLWDEFANFWDLFWLLEK